MAPGRGALEVPLDGKLIGVGIVVAFTAWACIAGFRERPGVLWTFSWVSILASGAALSVEGAGGRAAVTLLTPIFPAGQLAGALAYARGQAPVWVAPLAAVLVGVRLTGFAGGLEGMEAFFARLVEPALVLAAAAILAGAAFRRPSWSQVAVVGVVLLAAITDEVAATQLTAGGTLAPLVFVAWFSACAIGLPLQIHLASQRRLHAQTELTERTRESLVESRERFRALTESAFDMVGELDADECFTYVNPRYEEVLGHPRAAMIGHPYSEFVHPEDREAAGRFADEAGEVGRAYGLIVRACHADGSDRWLESAARAFVTPGGTRRWVLNSRDVTERHEQERRARARLEETVTLRTEELAESEARFRALADHAPELISEFDERGRYTFANEAFRELLGRDPVSLIGISPEEIIHPADLSGSVEGWAKAMRQEGASHRLHRLRHANGSWRWFDNTGRAYRNAAGEPRFVSIGRDVTEARKIEDERRRLEAHLQESQRLESLGILAGGIAHDFNNLLAVISGNADLLRDSAQPDSETAHRLDRVDAAARHAQALTEQLLAYAGKSVSELVPLDLSELVSGTENLLRASVSKKCQLELDLGADLEAVEGDATQLRQVLLNLALNASDALAEEGGRILIRTALCQVGAEELADAYGVNERPPGEWVTLEVADDGPGMDADHRRRVFDPFYTTKKAGRGLGLAASLGIVRAHRGVLRVESEPGRGTCFRLLLRPCGAAVTRQATEPARAGVVPPGTVLVVDDDEMVREVAEAILRRAGFHVESVASGRAALERVRGQSPPDAILLDVAMPDLSGSEVLHSLAAECPELPVVIASGHRAELVSEQLSGSAVHAILQKPYDTEALVLALSDALGSRRAD